MKDHGTITASLLRRNVRIYTALWSFVLGILVASFVYVPPLLCILIIAVALVIYFAERHVLILIALIAFALGALRLDIKDFHELQPMGDVGVVVSEPEHRESDIRFVFESDNGERALVSTDLVSDVRYGDRVEVRASWKVPGIIEDESGREFDYGAYLSKDDIYYTTSFAKVEIHGSGEGNAVRSALIAVKDSFVGRMKAVLPEPESSLLAGLLLAGKQALPKSVLEEFRNAGVVHIVVLSGYNVTLIAEFFLLLLGFLGTRRAAIGSAAGIILFTLMTGASATVVRASTMALLLLLGKIIGRPGSSPRILLATAVFMLIINPKSLVFDPSFQLTFLAMLALIYVAPMLQGFAEKRLPAHGQASGHSRSISSRLIEILSVTLATQIVVLPYLLYNMGSFSLVFLLSNLLVLLVVPYTMLVGFAAALLAYISPIIAWPLSFAAHLLLKWILFIAHTLGSSSWSNVEISRFPLWITLVAYVMLAVLIFAKQKARELVSRFRAYVSISAKSLLFDRS